MFVYSQSMYDLDIKIYTLPFEPTTHAVLVQYMVSDSGYFSPKDTNEGVKATRPDEL